MKRFTINDIRKWEPYYKPDRYLPESWQGTALDILSNKRIPFKDRLWVIMRADLVSERLMRRFAVWCARQVQHLMTDQRSLHALDVMEAYAENRWLIDDAEYAEAWEDERATARDAAETPSGAGIAAWTAAWEVAEEAARNAAWYAAQSKAEDAAAPLTDAVRAARSTARIGAAARAAAGAAAARDAARAAQEQKLREMLIAGIETGDTK